MTLLVFGSGYPMPPFIQRRLDCLRTEGIVVKLVLPFHIASRFSHYPVISAGGRISSGDFVRILIFLLVRPMSFRRLLLCRPDLSWPQRLKWALKHLYLANLRGKHIFHFQWLSFAAEFGWLKKLYSYPFVTSVRGSQLTVYPLTRYGYQDVALRGLRVSDVVHCVSNDLARRCIDLGLCSSKVFVNYNGVDLSLFRVAYKSRTGTFRIISVGSLIWRKGYLFQLLVVKKLLESGAEVELSLVGEGSDLEALRYWVHSLGIADNVRFVGSIEPANVSELLTKSDCYLSTSAAEGLANSVVEAAACGLPVIAFDCEGMREIILEGETGFVVPFGDVDKMVERTVELLQNPEKAKNFSLSAREHIERNFDQQVWVKRMVKFYQSL